MKRKLSFLMALVFILTLAFGVLPGASAADEPALSLVHQLTGTADHVDIRIHDATITVNTTVVEAGNPSNIISTSSMTVDADITGVTDAVITWNDDTTTTLTDFSVRAFPADYEYTKNACIHDIQDIKSVVFNVTLLDSNGETHAGVLVPFDQAGVQLAARNCDGSYGGKRLSGLDFEVAAVSNIVVEKTIEANKFVNVSKVWDDKGIEGLTHPDISITVTQTCSDTAAAVSVQKTLTSGEANVIFGFIEVTGKSYTYAVSEATVAGYIVSGGTVTPVDAESDCNYDYEAVITNTYDFSGDKTSFSGYKSWSDSQTVEHSNSNLILTLYANGAAQEASPTWDGNKFTFSNLPKYAAGDGGIAQLISYTVVETAVQNYTASYSGALAYCSDGGTITNTYTPPYIPPSDPPYVPPVDTTGSLIITKTVSGVGASPTERFLVSVTFSASPGSYTVSNPAAITVTNTGNVYNFSLAGNESVTFTGIANGATYSIVETVTQTGWTGPSAPITGTISTGVQASAAVANVFTATGVEGTKSEDNSNDSGTGVMGDVTKETVLPKTGGISSSMLLGIFGLALIAIGGTTFTIFKKRNTDES